MRTAQYSPSTGELPLCNVIHATTIQKVSAQMPSETVWDGLAGFFKLFSDKTRVGILLALSLSEMCVCDLSFLLKMKQPAISQHLKSLRLMRLVRTRREGRVIYYSLDDDHIRAVLNIGLQHIEEPVGTSQVLS